MTDVVSPTASFPGGSPAAALKSALAVLRNRPGDTGALQAAVAALAALGRADDALRLAHQGVALRPDDPVRRHALGMLLGRSGTADAAARAADCFRAALDRADPARDGVALVWSCADQLVRCGDVAAGFPVLHRLLRHHPEAVPGSWEGLSMAVCARQGDPAALVRLITAQIEAGCYPSPAQAAAQAGAVARGVPTILINTLPKSGSMYLCDVFTESEALPFLRVTTTLFPGERVVPAAARMVARGGAVVQQHMPADPENLQRLRAAGLTRMVLHVRDPRASLVSMRHHLVRLPPAWRSLAYTQDPGFDMAFWSWSADGQLAYLARTFFPTALAWLRDWFDVVDARDASAAPEILVTDHTALARDADALVRRIRGHFGLPPQQQPLPDPATGINFRQGRVDAWRAELPAAVQDRLWSDLTASGVADRLAIDR